MRDRLPAGWLDTTIDKLFRTTGGGTPATDRSEFWGAGVPWITSADLDDAGNISPRKLVTPYGIGSSATNLVPAGSVVVVTRVGLGKVGVANQELCFSQDCQALLFDPELIAPAFVAHQTRRAVRGIRGRGTTIAGVTVKQLRDLPFSLAPRPEQHRIVEAIDSYLTRLDNAMARLQRIQTKMSAYRASVLKASVEGHLVPTEASLARVEKRDYEPAEVLLARVLKERRRRWEEGELDRLKAVGRTPKDDNWKAKYKEPRAPKTEKLPALPHGWCWASVGQLVASLDQGWSPRCEKRPASGDEWGVMTTTAVQHLVFLPGETKAVTTELRPRVNLELRTGDLLVTRAGPRRRVGVCCLVRQTRQRVMLCDKVYRLKLQADISAAYVEVVLNSPSVLSEIEKLKTGISDSGVNLTQGRFNGLAIPLPPRREQEAIELGVGKQLSIFDEIGRTASANLRRVERLRQAVLKWAFEGKLVDQDPNDEPANKLFARIKVQRGAKSLPDRRQEEQRD